MSDAVVLDATPLGILCHPRNPPPAMACRQWVHDLLAVGRRTIVPEIADYEVRRELVRRNSRVALGNLDQLALRLEYLPLTTAAMRLAAELWAQVRSAGQPTAPDPALDADVILAAQALTLNTAVVVATGNPGHLNLPQRNEIAEKAKMTPDSDANRAHSQPYPVDPITAADASHQPATQVTKQVPEPVRDHPINVGDKVRSIALGDAQAPQFGPIDLFILLLCCAGSIVLVQYAGIGIITYNLIFTPELQPIGGLVLRDWFFNLVTGLTIAAIPVLFVQWEFRGRHQDSLNFGEWAWTLQAAANVFAYIFGWWTSSVRRPLPFELVVPLLLLYVVIVCLSLVLSLVFVVEWHYDKPQAGCIWAGWAGSIVSALALMKEIALMSLIQLP